MAASKESTARGYDAVADAYAEHLGDELDQKPFDRAFLSRFAVACPPGRLLDLGCGPGHVGRHLAGLGREIAGVDISPRMIAVARARHPEVAFHVGDMASLPFPDSSFAGVVAFYAIVHLDPKGLAAAFAEAQRVLAPGGLLAVSFHVGDEVRHVDALWGVPTSLDFVFFPTAIVVGALAAAELTVESTEERAPYPPPIEAQTTRCYLLARRP